MSFKQINFLGTKIDAITMTEAVEYIDNCISQNRKCEHVAINAAKVVKMCDDDLLRESVHSGDLITADGQAIVWASKLLGMPLPERVTGIDLMVELLERSFKKGYSVFLLGATKDTVSSMSEKLKSKYNENLVAGLHDGYFDMENIDEIIQVINNSNADIVFVAMPTPKKEIFMSKVKNKIKAPFLMGVGGSFDVYTNKVSRAPKTLQNWGLEWAYRLYQEPRKMWKRYLYTNTVFIYLILKESIKNFFQKKKIN